MSLCLFNPIHSSDPLVIWLPLADQPRSRDGNKQKNSYFINYVTDTRPGTSSSLGSQFLAGAQAAFAVGRFAGAALMHVVRPRLVFLGFLTACIAFGIPAVTGRGDAGVAMLYAVLFFESICFPTIVALGLRGLGRHTKRGSGWIVAGVFGGACVPPLTGAAADARGTGLAMVVPLCFFVAAWTYALAVNFLAVVSRHRRRLLDDGRRLAREAGRGPGGGGGEGEC